MDQEVSLSSDSEGTQADSHMLAQSDSGNHLTDDLHERIRQRAYEIYCSRNGGDGNAMDDWLTAEREVRLGRNAANTEGHGAALLGSVSENTERDVAR